MAVEKKKFTAMKLLDKHEEISENIKEAKREIKELEFKKKIHKDYLRRQVAKQKALKKELLNNHGFSV